MIIGKANGYKMTDNNLQQKVMKYKKNNKKFEKYGKFSISAFYPKII
jgi:hypothetical protein